MSTPARASTYAYVNPVIAVFLGWAVADEPMTVQIVLATVIIVTSVVLITAFGHRTPNTADAGAAGEQTDFSQIHVTDRSETACDAS